MIKALWSKDEVTLHDFELTTRIRANRNYMMSLSSENLMRNYNIEAGRYSAAQIPEGIHGGWESPTCQLRGHFTGHWLSAAAFLYHTAKDEEVKARAEAMVNELKKCQEDNGGRWAASIPEKYLHWIAKGKGVWAPQYTIHKTFMGLLDMAQYAGCRQALEVAENFAKWFLDWIQNFSREQFDDILDVETGGMLEIWVQLLELTGNDVYKILIDMYYRGRLFDVLLAGGDPLTNMHANTTIPEVLGCARAYDVTGDRKWRGIAEAYWNCAVTIRGQYATGGQTCGEIWTPPNKLDRRLGDKNQEYCTVYNMMRLADFLFRWTGDAKYADYCEQNLFNGIMAQSYWNWQFSQVYSSGKNNSGLLTYFLPLMQNGKKNWATETQDFFCCHGTLVQSNAIHSRGLYYQDGNSLYICRYFDSEVNAGINGQNVKISQRRDTLAGSFHMDSTSLGRQSISGITSEYQVQPDVLVTYFLVKTDAGTDMTLHFRVPYWISGTPEFYLNDVKIDADKNDKGFVTISRIWKDGDLIKIIFPMGVTMSRIPGNDKLAAFHYGPLTLAAVGAQAQTLKLPDNPEELLVHDNEREWGNWKSTFRTTGQSRNIRFIPLKDIGFESYSVYLDVE